MMPILESERLIIKAGNVEDFVKINEYDFNKLQNINGVFEFIKLDSDNVRSWFEPNIEEWYKTALEDNCYYFIVYLKENNEPIGTLNFDRNNKKIKSTEISCYVHPKYWGNGYMQEAIIKTMGYIYDNGFENIIYGYVEGNNNSKKLCEKLGFEPYKIEKDSWSYDTILPMSTYKNIMSKEKYYELYPKKKKDIIFYFNKI